MVEYKKNKIQRPPNVPQHIHPISSIPQQAKILQKHTHNRHKAYIFILPVGPKNMSEAMGLVGSFRPARVRCLDPLDILLSSLS